jgi:hypothetical protein
MEQEMVVVSSTKLKAIKVSEALNFNDINTKRIKYNDKHGVTIDIFEILTLNCILMIQKYKRKS